MRSAETSERVCERKVEGEIGAARTQALNCRSQMVGR
jgi:hypothetical protein